MENIIGASFAAIFLILIVCLFMSIAMFLFFQWLTLKIGMIVMKIENKKAFSQRYLGRVILVGFLISALTGITNEIPFIGAILSCFIVYFCHYKITFKAEDERIRKGMSIFYTVMSLIPNIFVSFGIIDYISSLITRLILK